MKFINVENIPLISIIVPCYNSERYLKRCIDSLLVQTYQNFELLLINDGSMDGTEEIIKSFQKDDRIRYFKKNNGGISSARNMGLDNHKGEYVLFVDSDDWVEPTYLENLSLGFDFDFCSNYYIAHELNGWISIPFKNKSYIDANIALCLNSNIRKFVFPFCKLYKSKIIKENNIYFDATVYAEDTLFTFTYLRYVNSIKIQGDALYHYDCSWPNSLSKIYVSWDRLSNTIDEIVNSIKLIEKRFDCDLCEAIAHFTWQYTRKYINYLQKGSISEVRKGLSEIVKNENVKDNLIRKTRLKKSSMRRCLDFLLCHEWFFVASAFIKLEQYLLSNGLKNRT